MWITKDGKKILITKTEYHGHGKDTRFTTQKKYETARKKDENYDGKVRERSHVMIAQYGVPGTPIDKENPYGGNIHDWDRVNKFTDLIKDARLRVNSEHTVGKIIGFPGMLDNYKHVQHVEHTKFDEKPAIKVGKTTFNEELLKQVTKDARMNKLVSDQKLETLFSNADFYYNTEKPHQPVLIKIKDFTYFVAPYYEQDD